MNSPERVPEETPHVRLGRFSIEREKLLSNETIVISYLIDCIITLEEIEEAIPATEEWLDFWTRVSSITRSAKAKDMQALHRLAQKKLQEFIESRLDSN